MSTSLIFPNSFEIGGFSRGLKDAFSRLRVSIPVAQWEATHLHGKDPLLWNELVSGTGTSVYNSNESLIELNPGTTVGNRVVVQSRPYMYYQPGRGQLIIMTGVMGTAQNQTHQRIGYFDDNNGLFFQQVGTTKSVVRRSSVTGSVVEETVNQADWNLDTLDGNGPSELTIDWTKTQIFIIEFEWLGVGIARFGFDVSGSFIYCHEMTHSNILDVPWIQTPNLPVRYETRVNASGASGAILKSICAVVMIEGESGASPRGRPFSVDTGSNDTSITGGNETGIIAIRPQAAFTRLAWQIESFTTIATSLDSYLVKLYFAPSITGGTWSSVTNSRMEVNSTFSSFSGGHVMLSAYGVEEGVLNQIISSLLRPGSSVDGTSRDAILLSITAMSTGSFTGGLLWREFE